MSDCADLPLDQLIAALRARKVVIKLADGELVIHGWARCSEAERERLRNSRAELIELLTPPPAVEPETPSAAPVADVTIPKATAASKVGLPPWRQGDSSKVRLVKTLRSGLRIYHDDSY